MDEYFLIGFNYLGDSCFHNDSRMLAPMFNTALKSLIPTNATVAIVPSISQCDGTRDFSTSVTGGSFFHFR